MIVWPICQVTATHQIACRRQNIFNHLNNSILFLQSAMTTIDTDNEIYLRRIILIEIFGNKRIISFSIPNTDLYYVMFCDSVKRKSCFCQTLKIYFFVRNVFLQPKLYVN